MSQHDDSKLPVAARRRRSQSLPPISRPPHRRSRPALVPGGPELAEEWRQALKLETTGDTKAALATYQHAVTLHPDCYEIWYNLGNLYSDLGDTAQAIESFQRSAALRGDDHEVWNNLGAAFVQAGRPDEAATSYRRALELHPAYHLSWNNLGNVLEQQGDLAGAGRAYDAAVALDPDRPEYRVNQASVLARLGNSEQAIGHLLVAIAQDPLIAGIVPEFEEFEPLLADPRVARATGWEPIA